MKSSMTGGYPIDLSKRLKAAGYTHEAAGNEQRMAHHVRDAAGAIVCTDSCYGIWKWLKGKDS